MLAPTKPTVAILLDSEMATRWASALAETAEVMTCADGLVLSDTLDNEWVKVVLADAQLCEGDRLIDELRRSYPQVQWIWLGSDAALPTGFACVARDTHHATLRYLVNSAVHLFDAEREIERLQIELELKPDSINQALVEQRQAARTRFRWDHGLVCDPSGPMGAVLETLRKTAPFDVSVLLQGESGTGKELCARALHQGSLRQEQPWIAVNCAAIPDDLLESELFGHRKGAFTHAMADHPGLFQQADGGTLFLDEIGEMSMRMQSKLLRVLQEKCVKPVGATQEIPVDVRVVAASNRDLQACVAQETFREDLFFRLATVQIHIPPLRERRGDIPLIARYLLQKNSERLGKSVTELPAATRAAMMSKDWPGNVRELENEIVRAMIHAESEALQPSDLSGGCRTMALAESANDDVGLTLRERVDRMESQAISEALERHKGNKSAAAAELGLSRVGLRNKLDRLGLEAAH